MNIFQKVKANITENTALYRPQIQAYKAALSHYKEFNDYDHRESLIVMPTGTGKTGVMSMLPFGIANGKVLIITPGKIVRKTVFNEFDTAQNPEKTFWIKQNIIFDRESLPYTYLYRGYNPKTNGEKDLIMQKVNQADIIITNVHKLVGSNDEVNLINLVNKDHFDMIIIDEAHHVAANMWQETLKYFQARKVIKLTATPFRGDKLDISTHDYDPIFEYTLGEAIDDGLVKNVVKQEEIPGKLTFFNRDTGKRYSLREAREKLGNGFVSKSIAMSEACSKQVIDKTKDILESKRKSYPNHQVLAVTCNDEHAQDICKWFNQKGLKATYVSTKSVSETENEQRLSDYANGLYDVMVSIQMLGEGYDNPNISIISLFRPFKTLGPYAQSIGRGLRRLSHSDLIPLDNFCNVIYHQELDLGELWEYYKNQESYGSVLKRQWEKLTEQLSFSFDELGYVEKRPVINQNDKETEEDLSNLNVTNTLHVSHYNSKGLGKEDSFTSGGFDEYRNSLQYLLNKEEIELNEYKDNLKEKVKLGLIKDYEADTLIRAYEENLQDRVNKGYYEFQDLIVSESMRTDFTRWLNTKLEEFFKSSQLEKEGDDLHRDDYITIDDNTINNIGYISRNIRQSLFDETKKSVSLYTENDFRLAKERTLEKLSFWLNQYGRKREDSE